MHRSMAGASLRRGAEPSLSYHNRDLWYLLLFLGKYMGTEYLKLLNKNPVKAPGGPTGLGHFQASRSLAIPGKLS